MNMFNFKFYGRCKNMVTLCILLWPYFDSINSKVRVPMPGPYRRVCGRASGVRGHCIYVITRADRSRCGRLWLQNHRRV